MTWKALKHILSFGRPKFSSDNSINASAEGRKNEGITAAASSARHRFLFSFSKSASPSVSAAGPEARNSRENVDDACSDVANEDLDEPSSISVISKEEMEDFAVEGSPSSISEEALRPYISNIEEIDEIESGHILPTRFRTIIKEPFTKNLGVMDDMLDAVLTMRNFFQTEDTSNNAEAVTKATAAGVKVRDFAASLMPPAPRSIAAALMGAASKSPKDTAIELFDAHRKSLFFFYLRFLVNAGIYDLPQYDFSVDDVDRLFTCGILGIEDFDNLMVASMLAHGTFRRLARTYGFAQIDGTFLPPRGPWTILGDYRRPTQEEIQDYIASRERVRFSQRYAIWPYRLAAFERPVMSFEYIRHRLHKDGFWGLKRLSNITDEEADRIFELKDDSFIPPEKPLVKDKKQPLLEGQNTELLLAPSEPGQSASQTAAEETTPVDRPASPSIAVQENNCFTPNRGRSTVSEGKKRARSTSVSCERHNDGSVRQTRRRLSDAESDSSTFPNASTHSSPSASVSPVQISQKRDKRMRDDDGDNEELNETSPAKKMRITRKTVSAGSSDIETRTVDDTELSVLADSSVSGTSDTVTPPTVSSGLLRAEPSIQLAAPPASNSLLATPPQCNSLSGRPTLVVDPAPSDGDSSQSRSVLASDSQKLITSGSSDLPPSDVRRSNAPAISSVTVSDVVPPLNERPARPSLPISARRGRSVLVDPNTGNIGALTRSGFILARHLRVEVPPDTEKSTSYALLGEGLVIPSWSEMCRIPRKPGPYEKAYLRAVSESQAAGMSPTNSQEQTSEPGSSDAPSGSTGHRRPLTRQHMCYLDEAFPQYHPRYYGRGLTRQPMRYLDEFFPDIFPKFVPSGIPFT